MKNPRTKAVSRPRKSESQRLTITWALTAGVIVAAALSLLTHQFYRWVDLRFISDAAALIGLSRPFGNSLIALVTIFWTVSVIGVAVVKNPQYRRALLWPTYLLISALLMNIFQYAYLLSRHMVTGHLVPMQGVAMVLLLVWCIAAALFPGKCAILLIGKWRISHMICVALCIIMMSGFLLLQHRPGIPPTSDIALVFGNDVLEDGTAGPLLRDRTLAAIKLYKEGRVKKIMLSGAMSPEKGSKRQEPQAMKKVCVAAGVPEEDLLLDPTGVNTRASVLAARRAMIANHWDSVVGVSNDFHLPRIALTFRQAGIAHYSTYASDPQVWQQNDPYSLLREVIGLPVYACVPQYRMPKAMQMNINNPRIIVTKSTNTLELYDGNRLIKTYHCISGTNDGQKMREGDRITPLGLFKIVYKNPESKYHLSMGLNYPRIEDAERGLKLGLLTKAEVEQIRQAQASNGIPNWYTKMGGEIMIHGFAEGRTSTAGCVAVSNSEIEELYAICDNGTEVEIRP